MVSAESARECNSAGNRLHCPDVFGLCEPQFPHAVCGHRAVTLNSVFRRGTREIRRLRHNSAMPPTLERAGTRGVAPEQLLGHTPARAGQQPGLHRDRAATGGHNSSQRSPRRPRHPSRPIRRDLPGRRLQSQGTRPPLRRGLGHRDRGRYRHGRTRRLLVERLRRLPRDDPMVP